jgi:hypothetical protein
MPGTLHALLHVSTLLIETMQRHLVSGGVAFGQDTSGFSMKRLRELVDEAKRIIMGRGYPVHLYVNLSALSALFRDWPTVLGHITHEGLRDLPLLMYVLLRLRVCNDSSLRASRERYTLYTSASVFVSATIVIELAELLQRE